MNENMVFDSGLECIKKCPSDKVIDFVIKRDVADKLEYLQNLYKDVEFLVYGNAVQIKNMIGSSYILDNIVIPEQKVDHYSVKDIQTIGIFNTVIHKHPGDVLDFSYHDEQYINSNHTFSILIGSKNLEKIKGVTKVKTECGKFLICNLNVHITGRTLFDKSFIDSTNNIKKVSLFDNIIGFVKRGDDNPNDIKKI